MAHLVRLGRGQLQAWRKEPFSIACISKAPELVGGHKVPDAITQILRDECRIVGEGLGRVARPPSVRQRRGQVPVEERDVRSNAVDMQLVEYALVVVQAR